jgi:hypothetical protein
LQDLAESLGIECGTRSIEARRNGGGLLVKFGRVRDAALCPPKLTDAFLTPNAPFVTG